MDAAVPTNNRKIFATPSGSLVPAPKPMASMVMGGTGPNASQTVAMTANALTHSLMPSRMTTCVAAGAGVSPSRSATADSTSGEMLL